MRGEHRMHWFEDDAFTGWRRYYAYLKRPGVRKAAKTLSHRIDRRQAKREAQKEARRERSTD